MNNMTLNDFQGEEISKREAEAVEDQNIMDLLGRFTAQMLKDALLENGHPEPEWGDGESWRFYYLEECKRRGKRLLEEIGWPTDEDAQYVNVYTGSIEPLLNICIDSWSNQREEDPLDYNVWTVIEHWQPYDPTLPNEFKIKYLEENLDRLYQLKSRKKKDAYVKSDIKKIPEIQKELELEKAKRRGAQTAS